MPQIINLLSNAPTHILEGIIKENTNSLLNPEIKKKLTNQLAPYILINLFEVNDLIKLEEPDRKKFKRNFRIPNTLFI